MKIKKSEIKEIIRQALNEVSSSDIKELEAIVKELAGASKMHKSQSERIDKIVKSVSKTEEKLTETKGKWAVINANDVLNMFAEKVVDTQKEAEKIAKQMKQKDKYGKYQAVSVKKWNQAKPGNKIKEDFGMSAKQLPSFSSKEAKTIIDSSIRQYANILRKAEDKIIKDWMSKAKSGVLDYFDIVRGLETGDASRAYPFELRFLKGILDRDKIMNRFRSYFKGKKGKKR